MKEYNVLWKKIAEWDYEVSNTGKFRNSKLNEVKSFPHKSGYLNIQLSKNGKPKTFLAHRLVAISFLGDPPTSSHEVAHRDGNRHNNCASNLRWVTHKENMKDRDAHGTTARGKRNGKLLYPDSLVHEIRRLHLSGLGYRKISHITGLHKATIRGYVKNLRRQTLDTKEVTP